MNKKAYPTNSQDQDSGADLRDVFAGQIAAAAMTNANGLGDMPEKDRKELFKEAAKISYEFADALMKARGN